MYTLILESRAENFLKRLGKDNQIRITRKLDELKSNPELGKPLVGPLKGQRSLRVGNYRIIYEIINGQLVILVLKIGHRKNVYD